MTKQQIRHFYAGGITSQGFVHYYDSSLQQLQRVFILKGGPGTGKSTLIQTVSDWLAADVAEQWHLHAAKDPGTLDGVVIPGVAAVVAGDAPHVVEPKLPGAVEQIVYFGTAWATHQLVAQKNRIAAMQAKVDQAYDEVFRYFQTALRVHDDWEAIFIDSMDFDEANKLTEELCAQFFGNQSQNKVARIDHRFLGAATPDGALDFIPNLTADIGQRYFIKGRPGCGKSTMLKQLVREADKRGYDMELYHCGFDPDSLDMLIMRELDIAIFDSSAPHEHFPSRPSDTTVDMYTRCMAPDTDERNKKAIARVSKLYKEKMKLATAQLAQAREAHKRLAAIYTAATDFTIVDQLTKQVYKEIKNLL